MSSIQYVKANTPIHRTHPVAKLLHLIITLVLVLSVSLTKHIFLLGIWLIFELLLWKIGKINVKRFALVLKASLSVSIFILVIQAFTYRGQTPILVLFHLEIPGGADIGVITKEGVYFGFLIIMRIITAICAVPIFTMTTKPSELMEALTQIKVPFVFSFMLVTAMRFTPMVQGIWDRIVDAQKLRRFDIGQMNIFTRAVKAYVPMMIPLILTLLRDANELQIAIESRGFGASTKRTTIEEVRFGLVSISFVVLISGLFTTLLFIRFFYLNLVLHTLFTWVNRFIKLLTSLF